MIETSESTADITDTDINASEHVFPLDRGKKW